MNLQKSGAFGVQPRPVAYFCAKSRDVGVAPFSGASSQLGAGLLLHAQGIETKRGTEFQSRTSSRSDFECLRQSLADQGCRDVGVAPFSGASSQLGAGLLPHAQGIETKRGTEFQSRTSRRSDFECLRQSLGDQGCRDVGVTPCSGASSRLGAGLLPHVQGIETKRGTKFQSRSSRRSDFECLRQSLGDQGCRDVGVTVVQSGKTINSNRNDDALLTWWDERRVQLARQEDIPDEFDPPMLVELAESDRAYFLRRGGQQG